jgi:hypothetical protein
MTTKPNNLISGSFTYTDIQENIDGLILIH